MKHIVIIGAGFAGLWAAISAARARQLFNQQADIQITLINKTPYHDIRVCNYQADIDSYGGAKQLQKHLAALDHSQAQTVVVVGSGFTGLEIATELIERLPKSTKILLIDRSDIASSLGEQPQEKILQSLKKLQIECLAHHEAAQITANSLILTSGKIIPTQTVICTTGLSASPLTQLFKTKKTTIGRLAVDEHLHIAGQKHCFAAGDVVHAHTDAEHFSLMSCQHAIPQGKIAGFNAVAVIAGKPMMSYQQAVYVTCLDLGPAGALFMRGWERDIEKRGKEAKALKQWINMERIRPVITSDADALLAQGNPALRAKVK